MDSQIDPQNGESKSRRGVSLIAFLRAIKFGKPKRRKDTVVRDFAHPHPRHRVASGEDDSWIRSAN